MRSWSRYTLASDLLPEAAMAYLDRTKYFYDLRENALQRMFTASPRRRPRAGSVREDRHDFGEKRCFGQSGSRDFPEIAWIFADDAAPEARRG
jgi:hypothetical protein